MTNSSSILDKLVYNRQHTNYTRSSYRFDLVLIYELLQLIMSYDGVMDRGKLLRISDWSHTNKIVTRLLGADIIGLVVHSRSKTAPRQLYMTEKGKILLRKLFQLNEVVPLENLQFRHNIIEE